MAWRLRWFPAGSTPTERVVDALVLLVTVGFAVLAFFTIWAVVPTVLMVVAGERRRLTGRARRSARRSQQSGNDR